MSRIRIKNFGPIKEGYHENDGWINIDKITVFIGNQGSGKSTIAKLISTMSWMEKALNRGDLDAKKLTVAMLLGFLKYQRINNYFNKDKTIIEYEGNAYTIYFNLNNPFPIVKKSSTKNEYIVPQIMYVPAERNFLSSVSDAFTVRGLPPTLFTFAEEFKKAQKNLNGIALELPINNYRYKYDPDNDISFVVGDDHQVNLLEASSGFQSTIPLFLVTRYLSLEIKDDKIDVDNINVNNSIRMNNEIAKIMFDEKRSSDEKNSLVKEIRKRYINKCLINIVEEPEQNLFPSSQHQMLNSLLKFNNMNEGNKLVMTTHSPYLINYLTLAVKANNIYEMLSEKRYKLSDPEYSETNEIVPMSSTIKPSDLFIYELDEKEGSIKKLKAYNGLPSDENELNERLGESNELFAQLLEIQQSL